MSNIKDCFGQNLKYLRKSKGYTQEQLSEKINIDIRQYSRIETGKGFPSLATLEKICEILDISPAYLFDFSQEKEVYNRKSPENELYSQLKLISENPKKVEFIKLALKAINGNKKSIIKMQSMLDGMLILSE